MFGSKSGEKNEWKMPLRPFRPCNWCVGGKEVGGRWEMMNGRRPRGIETGGKGGGGTYGRQIIKRKNLRSEM